eukprot:CAMPEP_0113886046 /NCGR_PEP_ID=MMETSP0780_2-20120614/11302_1 /TAXON_ID=652834 /ORGANISM="Palpitomonas bilix" /LENGTH=112 /DNA_ID=CAMNT_0000874147 /DNA_START=53 /DNA_END=391 /DNA_ORIENTATION=+ /assembly_acc=CAM_ASM_000599
MENEPKKVEITADSTESCATFVFHEEDHTVGNTLRYMLNRDEDVDFVGYSVPHPLERKMNLRVQVQENGSASGSLMQAMDGIVNLCNIVEAKYKGAMEKYEREHADSSEMEV